MSDFEQDSDGLLLRGLDGSNPLAFLAALGTLRTLNLAWSQQNVKMRWVENGGAWRPLVSVSANLAESEVTNAIIDVCCGGELEEKRGAAREHRNRIHELENRLLAEENELKKLKLKKKDRNAKLRHLHDELLEHRQKWLRICHPHLLLGEDTTVKPDYFRAVELDSARNSSHLHRGFADYVAALGTSTFEQNDGRISDTALRTMSGAGHQHFLGFMVNLLLSVTAEHVQSALFETWKYDDPVQNLTMRWDPIDDARYALQWNNPSGDPNRRSRGSVLGANVLGILGLPMMPTMPAAAGLQTVGFTGRGAGDIFWIWPIWQVYIDMDTCRSFLAHPAVNRLPKPDTTIEGHVDEGNAMGIAQRFRSRRITVGKIRSFTPSEAV